MDRSRFDRELSHFNICTLGWSEEGATALGIIIANTLNAILCTGDSYSTDNQDNLMANESEEFSINAVTVEYETENRQYTHIDFLSPTDYARGLMRVSFDGAILKVNALEGVTNDICEQVYLAKMAGIHYLAVLIDNSDLIEDYDKLEELADNIRNLLDEAGYCGEDALIEYSSLKEAQEAPECELAQQLFELIEMLDDYMPEPENERDKYFLMPIEDYFPITGRGTVATGRVETGVVKINDRLELLGLGADDKTVTVTGIEMFRKLMDLAEPGDNVGLLLRGIDKSEIKRGQVLAKLGACKCSNSLSAVVHFTEKTPGELIAEGTELNFRLRTALISGKLSVSECDINLKGSYAKITIELTEPVAITPSMVVVIEGKYRNLLGFGRVIEIL